jgi:hypothetical protein
LRAALLVAAATLVVGIGGLRGWSWLRRRRRTRSVRADGCVLEATATHDDHVGVLRVMVDRVTWTSREGFDVEYHESQIRVARVCPVPLIGAAELSLSMLDGGEAKFTVTAPAVSIVRSLSS